MPPDHAKSKEELLAELEAARQEIAGLRKVDAERKRTEEARETGSNLPAGDPHYLEDEFYRLVKSDSRIIHFLEAESLDGIWYWDLENPEHVWMSSRFWELFGYKASEKKHLTSEWQDMLFQEDLKTAIDNFQRHCTDENHPYDQLLRYRHKNGSTVWVRCRGVAIRDASGKPVRMLGAHNDVTELKRGQEELEHTRQVLDKAQEIAHLGSWEWDIETNVEVWSDEQFRIFGYEPKAVHATYNHFVQALHPEDRDRVLAAVQDALNDVKPYQTEFRIILRDKSEKHILAQGEAYRGTNGKATRMVGTVLDITERKRAEVALREREALLNATGEMANVGGWELDISANDLFWTDQVYRIHEVKPGYEPTVQEALHFYAPQSRPTITTAVEECIRSGQPFDLELEFDTAKGRRLWVRSIGKLRYDNGSPVKLVGTFQDITDRKRAEEALRESEENYKTIYNTGFDAIFVQDLNTGKFLDMNSRVQDMWGYSVEEAMEGGVALLSQNEPPYTMAEVGKRIHKAVTESPQTFEWLARNKQGHSFWIELGLKKVVLQGRDCLLTVARDITERKRTEEALMRSETRYALAQRAANIGSWEWDVLTGDLHWSDRIEPLFGFGPGQFGKTYEAFLDCVHPEDRQLVIDSVDASLEGEKDYFVEHRIVWPDGQVRWLAESGDVQRDDKGRPVRMFGVVQDITEQKQREGELRQLAIAVERSPATIVITDAEALIQYVNPVFTEITGYSAKEALGENPRVLKSGHHPPEFYQDMWKTLLAGKTWRGDLCNKKKNGEFYWENASIAPLTDEKGEILSYIAVKEDITERKELEQLREDVDRIMRHDLKSPLNGVIGLPQIMLDDENLTPEQVEHLTLIQETGYKMLNQINLSLDLYKMETGTFEYEPGLAESAGLLKRLLHDLGLKAGNKGVKLEALVKGAPSDKAESILFQADEALCYTMLANLLDNAVDASPMGERITLRMEEEPDTVVFSVHNVGPVPEAVRNTFFDKYATHGKTKGTGLGTYSAKLMAETQGGSIRMETSRQEGTTVTIRLPRG